MSDQFNSNQVDDFDFYGDGDGVADANILATGFRTIIAYNAALHHDGLLIEKGGFGIDVDLAPEGFGEIETIKNAKGESYKQRTCKQFSAAIIDVSDTYCTIPDGNGGHMRVATFQKGVEGCRTHFTLLLALDCDPERQIYQLTMSSHRSESGLEAYREVKRMVSTLEKLKARNGKKPNIHSYGVWVMFGLGEKKPVGKGSKQAYVLPLKIAQATDPQTVLTCAVGRDDYALFGQLREETRALIDSGYYKGISQSTELALA